jgi:hypothetical protein
MGSRAILWSPWATIDTRVMWVSWVWLGCIAPGLRFVGERVIGITGASNGDGIASKDIRFCLGKVEKVEG